MIPMLTFSLLAGYIAELNPHLAGVLLVKYGRILGKSMSVMYGPVKQELL